MKKLPTPTQFVRLCLDPVFIAQFAKYGFFGVVSTLTSVGTFYLFAMTLFPALTPAETHFIGRFLPFAIADTAALSKEAVSLNVTICNVFSYLSGNTVAYLTNIRYVFTAGRHHRLVEVLLFFGSAGIALIIGNLLMVLLISRFGWYTTPALLSNIFVSLGINFVVRKGLVFHG